MQPSSQKDKPIGFLLWDNRRAVTIAQAGLIIRPEELTKGDPSRNKTRQTLGGAWLDAHGTGISEITISGNTGWRGNSSLDGLGQFKNLRDVVYSAWNLWRQNYAESGIDPDMVELIFSDVMDDIAVVVAMDDFQLRRHKSRPLLSQFNIKMTVLRDASSNALAAMDPITNAITNPRGRYRATQIALSTTIKNQQAWAAKVDGALGFSLSGMAKDVLDVSSGLLSTVHAIVSTASGYIDATMAPLLYMATAYQQAARNVFQVLAAPANLGAQLKGSLMEIASSFNEAYCLLVNGFSMLTRFPDFSDLFGASSCSSTGGGRPVSPYSGSNPFLSMFPINNSPVTVSSDASSAVESLRQTDPLSMSTADAQAHANTMASGIAVA